MQTVVKRSLAALAMISGLIVVSAGPADAMWSGPQPVVTLGRALVNNSGQVYVEGTVDCHAAVDQYFGSDVPANTSIMVNVAFTVTQSVGRRIITATYDDGQASPCWTNDPSELANASPFGACYVGGAPCRWDASEYGSSGWINGDGAFRPGVVRIQTVLTNGFITTVDGANLDFYRMNDFTTRAKATR